MKTLYGRMIACSRMSEAYRRLAEKQVPAEEPEPDEKRAIEEGDELISEEELLQTLKK